MASVLMIVFDEHDNVLCNCSISEKWCFVHGGIEAIEQPLDAAYRILEEKTGITSDDIDLHIIRFESVSTYESAHSMHVMCGRLKHAVSLQSNDDELFWYKLSEGTLVTRVLKTDDYGECLTYYKLALKYLRSIDDGR